MVEGGIVITTALETIAEDIENKYLQQVLGQILEKMQTGETLSEAISHFPGVFNPLSQAIVLAGEAGGTLAASLRRAIQKQSLRPCRRP